jgi:hypothetical protein
MRGAEKAVEGPEPHQTLGAPSDCAPGDSRELPCRAEVTVSRAPVTFPNIIRKHDEETARSKKEPIYGIDQPIVPLRGRRYE